MGDRGTSSEAAIGEPTVPSTTPRRAIRNERFTGPLRRMYSGPVRWNVAAVPPNPFESSAGSLAGLTMSIPGLREDPTMCLRCRSALLLCGKPVCPILVRYRAFAMTLRRVDGLALVGSSPPGVFVGRFGFP